MSFAIIKTRCPVGIYAQSISVEIHLSNGLPAFTIVGLPEAAVKESKDRVRSAIINSQFEFPLKRITVNLAPASLPKSGSGLDLPIAIGILAASQQISSKNLSGHEFIGELALDGSIRHVNSIVSIILAARKAKSAIIIPKDNTMDASIIAYDKTLTATNLKMVCGYLCNSLSLEHIKHEPFKENLETKLDWSEVKGQYHAKNAMEIAAAGGHSVLLSGPPGSGKTMLAKRFNTLLPKLCEEKALECATIYSAQGKSIDYTNWQQPPFRSPHHTASAAALVGGGNPPKPGEISLAHNGILFLDELPEFHRYVLETLREPLESGNICISRATMHINFPAKFQLIAAMNPCPCGNFGNIRVACVCSNEKIKRYLHKLSGPFLDRIDIHIKVEALSDNELLETTSNDNKTSAQVQNVVRDTRNIQLERQNCLNSELSTKKLENFCHLNDDSKNFLKTALQKLNLSTRAYYRLLKVARTIADLNTKENVELNHLQKALSFIPKMHQDTKNYS